ncbi:MAG: hypothetical protein ACRDYC_07035 [Acidimicrobiales bacterium]
MRIRRAARLLAGAVLVGTATIGASCTSASAQTTGVVQLYEVDTANPQGSIIVTGVFNDYGVDNQAPGGNADLSQSS